MINTLQLQLTDKYMPFFSDRREQTITIDSILERLFPPRTVIANEQELTDAMITYKEDRNNISLQFAKPVDATVFSHLLQKSL